jgi:hypothetical protein
LIFDNKKFIDYTNKFGSEYKKAFLLFIRDENMNQVLENPDNLKEYIDSSDKLSSVEMAKSIILAYYFKCHTNIIPIVAIFETCDYKSDIYL